MNIVIEKDNALRVLNQIIAWYQLAQTAQGNTFNVSDLEDMIGQDFPLSQIYQLSHNIRNSKTFDADDICEACEGTGKAQVIELDMPAEIDRSIFMLGDGAGLDPVSNIIS